MTALLSQMLMLIAYRLTYLPAYPLTRLPAYCLPLNWPCSQAYRAGAFHPAALLNLDETHHDRVYFINLF